MILASNGHGNCCIMVAHPVHETVKLAADEMQNWLYRITGASLPVLTEHNHAWKGPRILLGDSSVMASWGLCSKDYDLGDEGFIQRCQGDTLAITGATARGTLYGVYAFLEEKLGLRFFTKDCTRVPFLEKVELSDYEEIQKPVFEAREPYWRHAFDGTWSVRNRLNSNYADISIHQGGRMKYYMFHHSFDELVPPLEYYDTHPEYYALVDGKRLREGTQLCLTNPDVQRLAKEQLERWITEHPDCQCFSISQNDNCNYCQCPACQAVDEEEESHAGTLIRFVNFLADAIAEKHPKVLLHSLAYQYTRKPPKLVKPRDNVIIRLCSIECCMSHPLDGSMQVELAPDAEIRAYVQCPLKEEPAFLKDMRDWAAISKHLYLWDYNTDFAHYLMPLPILDTIQKNYQTYVRMGVNGVFAQGNFSHGGGGNLAELYAYLQAKLLWNPDCDLQAHLQDFLQGYYGHSAGFVERYLELWQQAVRPYHMWIYEGPDAPFITDELLSQSDTLLNEALLREEDPAVRYRLEHLQLGITYMILCRMPLDVQGRDLLIDRFGWQARRHGITEMNERVGMEEGLQFMKKNRYNKSFTGSVRVDYKM